MDAFITHLELQRTSSVYQTMVITATILPVPAIIMMAVAGRGFIFWCLNILCVPVVTHQAKVIAFGKNRKNESTIVRQQSDVTYQREQIDNNNTSDVNK